MKARMVIIIYILLFLFVIYSNANGQHEPTVNETLCGTWISPKWDSPSESVFVPNEGFGKIIFSAEDVLFFRKSSDENDVGTDKYQIVDTFTDQNEIFWYQIVFFKESSHPWYYIFKISNSGKTCEYLCSYYDQTELWKDLNNGVYADWYLYKSSGSNQYDIMYRKD